MNFECSQPPKLRIYANENAELRRQVASPRKPKYSRLRLVESAVIIRWLEERNSATLAVRGF